MIDIPLHTLGRAVRTNALDIQATFDPKRLSVRLRNRMLRSLEQAYIPTNAYWGVGMITKCVLDAAGVFYMMGRLRGYIWVQWGGELLPADFLAPLNELLLADHTAATLQGRLTYLEVLKPHSHYFHMQVLKPQQHLVPLLKPHAESDAYKSAVEPYIDAVKSGKPIIINVKY